MAVSQLLRRNDYEIFCRILNSETLVVKEVDVGDIQIDSLKLESTNGGSTTLKTETATDYTLIFPDDAPSVNNQLLAIDDFTTGKLKYVDPQASTFDVINCNTLNASVAVNCVTLINSTFLETDTLNVVDKITSSLGEIDSLQVNEIAVLTQSTTTGLINTGDITTDTLNVTNLTELNGLNNNGLVETDNLALKGAINSVSLSSTATTDNYSIKLPSNAPTSVNQVLVVSDLSENQLSWVSPTSIPVTPTYPNIVYQNEDLNLIALNPTRQKVMGVSITPRFVNSKFKVTMYAWHSLVTKSVDFNTDVNVFYSLERNGVAITPQGYGRSDYGYGTGATSTWGAVRYYGPTITNVRIVEGLGTLDPLQFDLLGAISTNGSGSFLSGSIIVEEIYYP